MLGRLAAAPAASVSPGMILPRVVALQAPDIDAGFSGIDTPYPFDCYPDAVAPDFKRARCALESLLAALSGYAGPGHATERKNSILLCACLAAAAIDLTAANARHAAVSCPLVPGSSMTPFS